MTFSTLLVANRGEIAVRIIRTAKQQGYRTVAVYSEADADALHVRAADLAVCIGPAAVGESYLSIDNIIAAAAKTGADAVHPGYGFLSENPEFARACAAAELVFIGPPAAAIELMGSKRRSKLAMLEAGVPCIPGYSGEEQSDERLVAQAETIGYPLMIKASAGGGGRGMRLVHSAAEIAAQLRSARSEATSAFGSGELILEKALLRPRHIEIQVFADSHGNVVYLGERDCSIQRRHQKVVEEAPSPFVDGALRRHMGEAAVQAARACDYRGAGTVEFLVDADKNFYFLEMNTRLQVEHPVTELITGTDLVAWQLAVARGETLPLTQAQIALCGHAVEVRLYAEDPRRNFLPQTGEVLRWRTAAGEHRRTDHMLEDGLTVSSHYDPMLAKIIAWGEDREQACRRLQRMLEETQLLGVENNLYFLQRLIAHPHFRRGEATTAFLEEQFSDDPSIQPRVAAPWEIALAGVIFHCAAARVGRGSRRQDWSSGPTLTTGYILGCGAAETPVEVTAVDTGSQNRYRVIVADSTLEITLLTLTDGQCVYLLDGVRRALGWVAGGTDICVNLPGGALRFSDLTQMAARADGGAGSGEVTALMDGAVVDVLVKPGDRVNAGDTLLVLEAMKMEHPLKADLDGVVDSILARAGEQVKARQLLATVNADAAA
ncbi:acetyl/propionyl/methylcrotonyl-CoA carboxylase subunit alpha [Exilibacterium tricleocarpae]|uniref:Biotin carboxylase n=1 Tax=Exilibacterium tricleocarpae TaxID=2591008 RepID=A0A545TYZ1_9GAMM|nr:acetyl/propionyl/methylcrotonyl-CoA carboxylase subunit alpha [Exilibacterium tricleocarpae]TQV82438.1 acetyl/propionyl/methylcrotonyl-CoA carboxylase subunit alpha [Exilibacterium tricleocarpae]